MTSAPTGSTAALGLSRTAGSLTLFAIFTNNLDDEINNVDLGVIASACLY